MRQTLKMSTRKYETFSSFLSESLGNEQRFNINKKYGKLSFSSQTNISRIIKEFRDIKESKVIKVIVVTSLSVAFGFEKRKKITYIFWWCSLKKKSYFSFLACLHFPSSSSKYHYAYIYLRCKGIAKLKIVSALIFTPTTIILTRYLILNFFSTTRLLS